jgi:hypothetical protein
VEDRRAVLPRIIQQLVVALDILAGEGLGDDVFLERRGGEQAPYQFQLSGAELEEISARRGEGRVAPQ